MQPYVSPIEYAESDESNASPNLNIKRKKSIQLRKSRKICEIKVISLLFWHPEHIAGHILPPIRFYSSVLFCSHCHESRKSGLNQDVRIENVQVDTVSLPTGNPFISNRLPMGRSQCRSRAAPANLGADMRRYITTKKELARCLPQVGLCQIF